MTDTPHASRTRHPDRLPQWKDEAKAAKINSLYKIRVTTPYPRYSQNAHQDFAIRQMIHEAKKENNGLLPPCTQNSQTTFAPCSCVWCYTRKHEMEVAAWHAINEDLLKEQITDMRETLGTSATTNVEASVST